MSIKISIINGPNLNMLGTREPEIYGYINFDEYLLKLIKLFPEITFDYFQSNEEGLLISKIQKATSSQGIILNAAAYSHTSIALADTIAAITMPVVEVHISNIYARESFRHHSYLSKYCKGSISGLGLMGYEMAVRYFLNQE